MTAADFYALLQVTIEIHLVVAKQAKGEGSGAWERWNGEQGLEGIKGEFSVHHRYGAWPSEEFLTHVVVNSPAYVIRHCERDLRILRRHSPRYVDDEDLLVCAGCNWDLGFDDVGEPLGVCPDVEDLAVAYEVEWPWRVVS